GSTPFQASRAFPSRRSSDLRAHGMAAGEAEGGLRGDRFPQVRARALEAVLGGQVQQRRADEGHHREGRLAPLALQQQDQRQQHVDRKSTRLNSSHVKTSYAV